MSFHGWVWDYRDRVLALGMPPEVLSSPVNMSRAEWRAVWRFMRLEKKRLALEAELALSEPYVIEWGKAGFCALKFGTPARHTFGDGSE